VAVENGARRQAREFIGQFEQKEAPIRGIGRMRQLVMTILADSQDERVKRTLEHARYWIQASAIRRDAYDQYGSLHDPDTELGEGESPGAGLALSAAYLGAAVALETDAVFLEAQTSLGEPETVASDVRRALSPAREGFVGELMLEAARRRRENSDMARRIGEAKEEIKGLIRDLGRERRTSQGPQAYGFVIEWGSEVLDAIAVGIAIAVVIAVVVVILV
jgi:hypothetical protein